MCLNALLTFVDRRLEAHPRLTFTSLMFLRSLCDEELLQYNFGLMKWRWDDDAVKAKLATENVATILLNKLSRLHWATQNVLKVASCLGAKFSLSAVAAVTGNLSQVEMRRLSSTAFTVETEPDSDGDTISALDSSTKELEDEGLWEKESEDVRHFGHDKIQLAAFELIPPDKRDSFRGRIGNILLEKLDPDLIEANLFAIVSLRNCAAATICDDKERKELANMSLRAGMKVRTLFGHYIVTLNLRSS